MSHLPPRLPASELLILAVLAVLAVAYGSHRYFQAKARAEIEHKLDQCLKILPLDEAPSEPVQLVCRALYRDEGLAKPIRNPLG